MNRGILGLGEPHQSQSAQRIKASRFVLKERMGEYVLSPSSTRDLAPGWTIQILNPVIMCCGQGRAGFSVPHPFPVVGGSSTRSSNAKFPQLSPPSGEVRGRPKCQGCKHKASHCEGPVSTVGQASTRMASFCLFVSIFFMDV